MWMMISQFPDSTKNYEIRIEYLSYGMVQACAYHINIDPKGILIGYHTQKKLHLAVNRCVKDIQRHKEQ